MATVAPGCRCGKRLADEFGDCGRAVEPPATVPEPDNGPPARAEVSPLLPAREAA